MPIPWCNDISKNFCYIKKPKIDSACHELSIESGKKIMWEVNDQTCYCICSCLGEGTGIMLSSGQNIPIQNLTTQQQVLAAGLDLNFHAYPVEMVTHAASGTTQNTIFLTYTLGGSQKKIVVTMDQPMLVRRNGKLMMIEAKTLQLADRLVDRMSNDVAIDKIDLGTYVGAFWEMATSMTPPDKNFTGHLVVTEGIVTGDFAVTTFVDFPAGVGAQLTDQDKTVPIMGTKAWRAANLGHVSLASDMPVNNGIFKSAALHDVPIPAHASAFLPTWQSALLELVAPKVGIDDSYYLQECEFLLNKLFTPSYPDIKFLFNWYSDDVNSYSWVDQGKKYVYLSGGLARIVGFEYEGIALALAHEVGHLLGKPDIGPGVTCEGEADWYGAQIVLRNIWFGQFYFQYTKEAIKQLVQLYAYLRLDEAKKQAAPAGDTDKFGQPYPSNACRIQTISDAMRTPDKPACAECRPIASGSTP